MWNTIRKLYFTASGGFQGSWPWTSRIANNNPKEIAYKDKYGKVKTHRVFAKDLWWQYMGLVIPWGIINYNWGQIYGNGQFGKFILSLVILSAGLIFMGGISIFVFLCVFIFYCAKTLAMFGDNVKEQKK